MSEQEFLDKLESTIRKHLANVLDDEVLDVMCRQLHDYPKLKTLVSEIENQIKNCEDRIKVYVGQIEILQEKQSVITGLTLSTDDENIKLYQEYIAKENEDIRKFNQILQKYKESKE